MNPCVEIRLPVFRFLNLKHKWYKVYFYHSNGSTFSIKIRGWNEKDAMRRACRLKDFKHLRIWKVVYIPPNGE